MPKQKRKQRQTKESRKKSYEVKNRIDVRKKKKTKRRVKLYFYIIFDYNHHCTPYRRKKFPLTKITKFLQFFSVYSFSFDI